MTPESSSQDVASQDGAAPSANGHGSEIVFLIGLSGTGKSTVGRLLADRLGVAFIDTDAEIERKSGRTVREIFRELGDPAFRAIEREVVAAVCRRGSGIVATGGGAPLDPSIRAAMREAGTIVWLDAPTRELAARLALDETDRPLLADDPQRALDRLLEQRRGVYADLGQRIDASGQPEEIVDRVLALMALTEPADRWLVPVWVATPSRTYPVYVGAGILDHTAALLQMTGLRGMLRIITDERVDAIHGNRLRAVLGQVPYTWHVMPAGEEHKTLAQADRMFDALLAEAPERRDVVVAFGGGVVGDLAGFVAATLLRGLRLVQIPTTVLSQVDSSVGGKVAVDHPRGKNLIGAFHQPSLVIADVDLLGSLPKREIAAGWAEVVKIAVIQDAALFEELERDPDSLMQLEPLATSRAIRRAVELKAHLAAADERDETGVRAILNYGHTIGHALEAATEFSALLHGEAVAIGMRAAAHVAWRMGIHPEEAAARQAALLRRFGLPDSCLGVPAGRIRSAMGLDKKRHDGRATWILPAGLGAVRASRDVPAALVDEAIALVTRGRL